ATASSCVAVGTYTDSDVTPRTAVYRWDGATWSAATAAADGTSSDQFSAVSCASASHCIAVRRSGSPTPRGFRTPQLIQSWSNGAWNVVPAPKPASPAKPDELSGVSCVSTRSCVAVGDVLVGSHLETSALVGH